MEKQPSRKALMEKIDALEAKLRKAQQDLQRELARQSTSLADATMALKASDARKKGVRSVFHYQTKRQWARSGGGLQHHFQTRWAVDGGVDAG